MSAGMLSYGIEVITPAIIASPDGSGPGELGLSIELDEEILVCREEREATEPDLSRSPPK